MIDTNQLKFGDTVYVVETRNNAFSKQKIKTVIDGVEWFRYDQDHWEYSIKELVYCGRVVYKEYGEVAFNEDRQNELHFRYPEGQIYCEFEDDFEYVEDWFQSRSEAEAYIEQMKLERDV